MAYNRNTELYDFFFCYKECFYCEKPWGMPDAEGNLEHPVITPCGYPFGNRCLKELAPCPSGLQDRPQGEYCPWCGMDLLYRGCKHIIRPQKATLVKDEKGEYVIPAETLGQGIPEDELPEYCRSCAISRLRFHSVYSELEKELSHYLSRRAWLVNGVTQRGLSQRLLDEANENVRKCQTDMEALKPSVAAEWQQFQESRKGCIAYTGFLIIMSSAGQAIYPFGREFWKSRHPCHVAYLAT